MIARLGSALVLIGLIFMVVFLVTFSAGRGDLRVLLSGAVISALGLLLRRRRPDRPTDSGRFQTLRRMMGEQIEPDEEGES
jgi:hypothetical protein